MPGTDRNSAWLRTWDTKLKLLLGAGAVVAMIWGAITAMNATYTMAKEFKAHEIVVTKQFSGTTAALLQFDLRDLKRQLYELEETIEMAKGRATPKQTRRQKELLDQIEQVPDPD